MGSNSERFHRFVDFRNYLDEDPKATLADFMVFYRETTRADGQEHWREPSKPDGPEAECAVDETATSVQVSEQPGVAPPHAVPDESPLGIYPDTFEQRPDPLTGSMLQRTSQALGEPEAE